MKNLDGEQFSCHNKLIVIYLVGKYKKKLFKNVTKKILTSIILNCRFVRAGGGR